MKKHELTIRNDSETVREQQVQSVPAGGERLLPNLCCKCAELAIVTGNYEFRSNRGQSTLDMREDIVMMLSAKRYFMEKAEEVRVMYRPDRGIHRLI